MLQSVIKADENGFGSLRIPPMENGTIWKNTDGHIINAHGGGILFHENTYYWFGEIKTGETVLVPDQGWENYRVPAGGVSCYTSKDLKNWENKGVALAAVMDDPLHDLHTSKVIERPKVIYNQRTQKFVMWLHVDSFDYAYSQAGVATSDHPEGPYTYKGSVRPNGNMSRDLTVFKDDDDKAYLVYASEFNKTLHVCVLNDDYCSPTTIYSRITSADQREAPAIFKYKQRYYLITSGCSGWEPNESTCMMTDDLLGKWQLLGSPFKGKGAATTFQSQGSFVLPYPQQEDIFVFMADRWNKTNLPDSRYVWLPFEMKGSKPVIRWKP